MTDSVRSTSRNSARALPKITVVTPSYNQGEFLERTIQSVLSQGYPDLEYIVIDGGSTDGSVEIIKEYENRLDYWISEPDRGQPHAINKGFERSTGEILAWLNSDDTYEPGALLAMGRYFREHPELDVVYGDANFIDQQDRVILPINGVPFNANAFIYSGFNIHQVSTFWRGESFFQLGALNEDLHFAMDDELFYRFIKAKARFKYLPISLGNLRRHSESKTFGDDKTSSSLEAIMVKERLFSIREDTLSYRIWHYAYRLWRISFLVKQMDIGYIKPRLARKLSLRGGK